MKYFAVRPNGLARFMKVARSVGVENRTEQCLREEEEQNVENDKY
jgi:hypothetical protein